MDRLVGTPRHRSALRRGLALAVAVAALAVGVIVAGAVVDDAPRLDAQNFQELRSDRPGPLGPIGIFGDSVMLGSGITRPTIVDRLAALGWGPIRYVAAVGYNTGAHGGNSTTHASYWIDRWRAEGFDPSNWIIHLGANDAGACRTNSGCVRRSIETVLDRLGPTARVWWPMITHEPSKRAWEITWNDTLNQMVAERPSLLTWDWPAVLRGGGFGVASDNIHLSGNGYIRRSQLMAERVTADLATASEIGQPAAMPNAIGAPMQYLPVRTERVADTRRSGRLPAGGTVTVDLAGVVPAGTTAVAVNLTSSGSGADGFLTAAPCGGAPAEVSSVNYRAGVDRAALAIIALSPDRRLCVTTSAPGHVLVDLQGAFVPGGAMRFSLLGEPQRLVDTRGTPRRSVLRLQAPAGATAVALNLTAMGGERNGFLSALPCTSSDIAWADFSNVNFTAGEAVAGSAYVPVSASGEFCVFASAPVDIAVDLVGTFAPNGQLVFVPAAPTRMVDTRHAIGGWGPVHGAGQTIDAPVAPVGAVAVTGTLTMVQPGGDGFTTAWGCGTRPATSNVNARPGAAMANSVTSGLDTSGQLCLYTSTTSQTLFDTTGWWVAAPLGTAMAERERSSDAFDTGVDNGRDPALETTAAPPERRVYMVADSVALGTRGYFQQAFAPGWQAVVDGQPARFVEQLESGWVRAAPSHLIGDYGVVAGGYNYPYWDPARFDRSIDSIIRAFRERGAEHVFWVTLREVKPQYVSPSAWQGVQRYNWYFPIVNDHLERALERHPELTLVDWAAAADRPGITYDAIHLNPTGARLYSELVRDHVEMVDDRAAADSVTRVAVPQAGGAAAVAVTVTTANPRTAGYVSVYACDGPLPQVSTINHRRDEIAAATAIVALSASGEICVYTSADTNLSVDLVGRFARGTGLEAGAPERLVDTRLGAPAGVPAGEVLRVPVGATAARAVVVNLTAIGVGAGGYATVWPCDTPQPATSTINYVAGSAIPNLTVVTPGASGEICVVASSPAHLIVDRFAGFAPSADVVIGVPQRVVDTRRAEPVAAGVTREFDLGAGAPGRARIVNLTAAAPTAVGTITVHPCGGPVPGAPTLAVGQAGVDRAGFAIVSPDADGRICVTSTRSTHLVVDVLGSFGAPFRAGGAPERLHDTRAS